MKFLKSKWMVPAVGAVLYFATVATLWKPTPPAPAHDPTGHETTRTNKPVLGGPSWNFYNPELDQLIAELKKEKEEVAVRKRELDELATRLQTERLEISSVTNAVQQLRADFDKTVSRIQEEETANLKKLAKIYSTMTPDAAVTVLQELDDAVLVKILVFMKDAQTAPLLEALAKLGDPQAKRAARISERLRLSIYREADKPKA